VGDFYMYKSRQEFRQKPKKPIYLRPLRLQDHYVRVVNADDALRAELDDENKTVSSSNSQRTGRDAGKRPAFRFQITLVPRENEDGLEEGQQTQLRNVWMLRCDTEEELEIWMGVIREVCPSCIR
jgi:hypothetical protein